MSIYNLKTKEDYKKAYQESTINPSDFWSGIAEENFIWKKKWNQVLDFDKKEVKAKWFVGAELNITENCIDRHLEKNGNKTAILFEPNNPDEKAEEISYIELHQRVCQFANVLKSKNINKGDRVCLYLPMIPELAIAVLACARIGAIHSVVFAGFSATALASRINDSECKIIVTSDGAYRGNKVMELKKIVDEALLNTPCIEKVLVVKRTNDSILLSEGRDEWIQPLLEKASTNFEPEIMSSEDPLFILYTSGSTGQPKGMVHTCGGYMVYTAYSFNNVFQYEANDVYWCTADIGWVTGHSYIVYGPLANGATTVMFEGVPSYPDFGRFWNIIEKHKVNQFYTAPTAIRALAKESLDFVNKYDLTSLKTIGTVGEPINEEAWHWYNDHIGKKKCPIVDTWWQTETGGIMISSLSGVTPSIPTYATLPLPGIQPVLIDDTGETITLNPAEGKLYINHPWPSMARTIYGNHQRYIDTYFSGHEGKYFTGDGAYRDENGNYRITGRVDDVVIVSGHNLGTAPIEDAINQHHNVAESAIVGFPHDIKGNALYGYVILKDSIDNEDKVKIEINKLIATKVGAIAKLEKIQFVSGLPKTRSGKIMRRILRKIAEGITTGFGDISTLLNPEIIKEIMKTKL